MRRTGTSRLMCTAGIFVLAAGLGSAKAQSVSEQPFVSQAAMANMAEIQLGHLAMKKAQSDSVKKFAQQMVDDHIKAQNELADAALGGGIQWPKRLEGSHAALQSRLSALSGPDFDREYIKAMVSGHREVETLLATRMSGQGNTAAAGAKSSSDPQLTANVTEWSAKTLPAVREHLKKAEAVSAGLAKAR